MSLTFDGKRFFFTSPNEISREKIETIPYRYFNRTKLRYEFYPKWEVINKLRQLELNLDEPAKKIIDRFNQKLREYEEVFEKIREIKAGKIDENDFNKKIKVVSKYLKTELYSFQKTAFYLSTFSDSFAFLMEQGTGKTLCALSAMIYHHKTDNINKVLIVCPKIVAFVWRNEIKKHIKDLRIALLVLSSGTKDRKTKKIEQLTRIAKNKNRLCILVINYESSWRVLDAILSYSPDMVICDESQKIKNPTAKQSKGLHKLGEVAKYRYILTGTPITETPLDVFSQYKFLNYWIFGKTYQDFKNKYAVFGGFGGYEVIQYKNLDELSKKVYQIAFRITKKEALDLPECIDQETFVELSDKTRIAYGMMKKEAVMFIENNENEIEASVMASIILTKMLKLQQICGGTIIDNDNKLHFIGTEKVKALLELLDDLPQKRIVIFCRFIGELKLIGRYLEAKKINFGIIYGETSAEKREEILNDFNNNEEVKKVLLLQIGTGGLGIDLSIANIAIFYSLTFSYAEYSQAKARLHRIGQKNKVTYIHLLARNTIDEKILNVLKSKMSLSTLVLDELKEIVKSS